MPSDHDIGELLSAEGFDNPEALKTAREALELAGLTRVGKTRIADEKVAKVRELLARTFSRTCVSPDCQATLRRDKPAATLLRVQDRTHCEHCGGSDNRKAMRRLSEAAKRARAAKFVVVGGSPSVREELSALKPAEWQLRLIDGTERRTTDRARADVEWADLVVVWGSSELDHKVSRLYTDVPPPLRRKIVQIARRGVAALLMAAAEHLEKTP